MTTLSNGDALQVIGGPVSGEGYTWFQVAGPVAQWGPVDPIQVGGWIAASGNGATNAGPRRPVYVTRINAGITGLRINNGGQRVLTPTGAYGTMHLDLDESARIRQPGAADIPGRWHARRHGSAGWHGDRARTATTGTARSAGRRCRPAIRAPAPGDRCRHRVQRAVGEPGERRHRSPGSGSWPALSHRPAVVLFARPGSPTRASSVTWKLTFGGRDQRPDPGDFVRHRDRRRAARSARPPGPGATWTVTLTGCSAGTVVLGLAAKTVVDAVEQHRARRRRSSAPSS